MEFLVFGAWLPYFLMIMGGCLVLMLLLLFISNRYIKKKLNQIEQTNNKR